MTNISTETTVKSPIALPLSSPPEPSNPSRELQPEGVAEAAASFIGPQLREPTEPTTTPNKIPSATMSSERAGVGTLALIDQLLRDRRGLLDRIEADHDLAGVARAMILTIIVSAAVFGASLGLHCGGLQVVYALIKLPLVILLTAALATPALSALRSVVEGHTQIRRDIALVLSSLALGSLVIAALAPIVMLAVGWNVSYHTLILLTVGCCAVGGLVGLSLFISGTRETVLSSRVLILSVVLLVVGLVGAQMTWTMRPYLVRPQHVAMGEIPFLRSLEGSFLDSVNTSTRSAMGIYSSEESAMDIYTSEESP